MIKVQGHRGYPDLYPENTMLSFQKAYEVGADGIETDLRTTADGEIILIHDTTVDRTTNGTGAVSELTWDYIKGLDAGSWKGSEFTGREDCKIPHLDEFLDEYRYKEVTLILHLYVPVEDIPTVVDKVVARGMLSKVHFFSGITNINAVKEYNPNAYTYNGGMPGISDYQLYIDNALENNHNAVSVNANINQTDLQIMSDNTKYNGLKLHGSFLSGDYNVLMQRHLDVGTDYILGNNPAMMVNFLKSSEEFNIIKYKSLIEIEGGYVSVKPYIDNGDFLVAANKMLTV